MQLFCPDQLWRFLQIEQIIYSKHHCPVEINLIISRLDFIFLKATWHFLFWNLFLEQHIDANFYEKIASLAEGQAPQHIFANIKIHFRGVFFRSKLLYH